MAGFIVHVGHSDVELEERVFHALLNLPYVMAYKAYTSAVREKAIALSDLKKLAQKADVPYPLFFAPYHHVAEQIRLKEEFLAKKLPTKKDLLLSFRGSLSVRSIELIGRDLAKKQEFLKRSVLPAAPVNDYVGFIAKATKLGATDKELADAIRSKLGINLQVLRTLSKKKVLGYITALAEKAGILVSQSSYNYMPQPIARTAQFSGFCVKDSKFPFVFINTRDGDEEPLILETEGRQVFTLLAMLVFVAKGRFVLGTNATGKRAQPTQRAYMIVGEILIPEEELRSVRVESLKDLKDLSTTYKVTPSMLLRRLETLGMNKALVRAFRSELKRELKSAEPPQLRSPLPHHGFEKYNGQRFSREVVLAYRRGKISQDDFDNVLFRRRRVTPKLVSDYLALFP